MDDSSRCAATSWGLEYVFLFGLPENKLEFFGAGGRQGVQVAGGERKT